MKSLSKAQKTAKMNLVGQLTSYSEELTVAIGKFNEQQRTNFTAVESALAKYNLALAEVRSFAEQVFADAEAHYNDASEKWQEGEKGQEYAEWKDAWEQAEADMEDVEELEPPPEIEEPDLSHADTLDGLADAPGE